MELAALAVVFIMKTLNYKTSIEPGHFVHDKELSNSVEYTLKHYFPKDFPQIIFLAEEFNRHSPSQQLVQLPWAKLILESSMINEQPGIILLFPDSRNITYEIFLNGIKEIDQVNKSYLIVTEFFNWVSESFDLFWKYHIINIVALLKTKSGSYMIFSYFPFQQNDCSNTSPILESFKRRSEKHFVKQYPTSLYKSDGFNLNGCELKIAIKDVWKPTKERNGTALSFITGELLQLLRTRINFSPSYRHVEDELDAYVASYFNYTPPTILNVVKEKVDLGVGHFTQIIDSNPGIVFTRQTGSDCFTWALPISSIRERDLFWIYFHLFDASTWGVLGLAYFSIALLDRVVSNRRKSSTLQLFGLILGVSVQCRKQRRIHYFLIGLWSICISSVTFSYQAALGSLMTVPPEELPIKTVNDLLNSNLKLYGDPKVFSVLNASAESSHEIKMVLDRFKTLSPGDIMGEVMKMHLKGDIAVLDSKLKLSKEELDLKKTLKLDRIIYFLQECIVNSVSTQVIVKRGSIFEDPMRTFLVRLFESGIIGQWEKLELEHGAAELNTTSPNGHQSASFSKIKGAIILLVVGLLVSIVTFLCELIVFCHRKVRIVIVKDN